MKNKKTKWLYMAGAAVLVVALVVMANYGAFGENLQGMVSIKKVDTTIQEIDLSSPPNIEYPENYEPTQTKCSNILWNTAIVQNSSEVQEWLSDNGYKGTHLEYCKNQYGKKWYEDNKCKILVEVAMKDKQQFENWLESNNTYSMDDVQECAKNLKCDDIMSLVKKTQGEYLTDFLKKYGYEYTTYNFCRKI